MLRTGRFHGSVLPTPAEVVRTFSGPDPLDGIFTRFVSWRPWIRTSPKVCPHRPRSKWEVSDRMSGLLFSTEASH